MTARIDYRHPRRHGVNLNHPRRPAQTIPRVVDPLNMRKGESVTLTR